jgi:parallel beta-helix repeat protein
VKDFGAKGDGSSDDQAALQKAIDQAKASGQSVWIPPGTYNHSGVLNVDGVKVSGAGEKTVLNATNPDQEAIKLTGNHSSVSNLKTTVKAPGRSSMPDAAAILVQNASNASVTNVMTQGAASNGIRLDNATGSTISHDLVMGSNADGIALMNGSSGNMIKNNVVYQAGDDSFSDDSYTSDAKQDQNNTFDSNLSLDNSYGRGMCFAGSKNDTVTNNTVSGSKWIGIWGDTDPNSGTMQSSGHRIENNTVINSPNGAPVQASGSTVTGTKTSGSVPSLAAILGWTPEQLIDRNAFNAAYTPGTGSGASNSGGSRS